MKETSELRREATAWFLDIHDAEDPSPELLQEWMQWMEASVEHRQAFMAVERTWHASAACVPPAPSRKPPGRLRWLGFRE